MSFCRKHYQCICLKIFCMEFEINWTTDLGDGLALTRWHAITWINADPFYWQIYGIISQSHRSALLNTPKAHLTFVGELLDVYFQYFEENLLFYIAICNRNLNILPVLKIMSLNLCHNTDMLNTSHPNKQWPDLIMEVSQRNHVSFWRALINLQIQN